MGGCQEPFKTFLKINQFLYEQASLTNTIDTQGMNQTRVKMATGKNRKKLLKAGEKQQNPELGSLVPNQDK